MKTYTRKRQEIHEIEDVHELCRLCLRRSKEGFPIFQDVNDVCAALAMRIMICVGLEMKYDDCLPNIICSDCHEELERSYKFRRKCEVSYHRLKSHLLALKEKDCYNTQRDIINRNLIPAAEGDQLEENVQGILENKESVFVDIEMREEINKMEKIEEIEEVEVPIETEVNPHISTFLTSILTELGILVRRDDEILVQDPGVSFELETGDEEQVMFELVEEDDEMGPNQVDQEQSEQKQEIIFPDVKVYKIIGKDPLECPAPQRSDRRKVRKKKNSGDIIQHFRQGSWCQQCGKTFASRSTAARHRLVHSGAKPYECDVCGKSFAQKVVLKRHQLVHLAVRPHKCDSCNKSFTQRGALAAHARAHAPPAARHLALHRCTTCDKVFLYASGLSRHMATHSGAVFACRACGKKFKDKSSLLRHLRNSCRAADKPQPHTTT